MGRNVGVGVHGKVKSYPHIAWGHGQCCDHGDLLVEPSLLVEDGSLSSWRPSTSDDRGHQQPAFVDKRQMSVQLLRFFLRRGHSCLTQRWIAFSSRSRARRSGFWGLQPIERKSLGM